MLTLADKPKRGRPKKMTPEDRDELFKSASALGDLSSAMIVLAENAPDRMSLSQGIFFVITAGAILGGKMPTYSSVKEVVGDQVNRSLHNTYRVLLEPSRLYPQGLGWLKQVPNPNDAREKFLTLTPEGRRVVREVLEGLGRD